MAKVLTDESNYEDIADAIREKNGSSDTYLPSEMAEAVRDIPTGGAVQSVNGKTGAVVLNAADVGAKAVQTAVSDPTAQSNSVTFIDSISQDTQGKITATKKYVRSASENETGLMLPSDKIDIKNLKSGLAYTFPIKSTLDYPIPKGTAVFFSNDKNINYIYISDIDIMNAEDDALPGAWRGPLIPAYAYTQHIQSVLDRNDVRMANVENANATLQDDVLAVNEMALAAYPMDSAEGRIASFSDGAAGLPLKALTVDIVPVQAGSGTPSPTNVRAISGWTGAQITVNSDVISITFPTEAGTVYGGTLDVTRGVLTVDKACVEFDGSSDETIYSELNGQRAKIPNGAPGVEATSGRIPVMCNIGTTSSGSDPNTVFANADGSIYYYFPTSPMTVEQFRTLLANTPMQVVYKIATPVPIQLTPIEVLTLLGANTISANCGGVSVTYRADPTLFVSKGQTEDDMTANAPIAIGKYFQIGNTLYRATAAIATGETIAPEINCVVTNLAEALNLLNT